MIADFPLPSYVMTTAAPAHSGLGTTSTDALCTECRLRAAVLRCDDCGEILCASCDTTVHSTGTATVCDFHRVAMFP